MKIRPYKSLVINKDKNQSSLVNSHNAILDSRIYFKNRKEKFDSNNIYSYCSKLLKKGVLKENRKPCFYVHEETYHGNTIRSLLACVDITESINGNIIKHEQIFQDKIRDMCHCFRLCPIQTEPIMLFFTEKDDTITKLIAEVIDKSKRAYSFISVNDREHRYWEINKSIFINKFIEAFREIEKLYVADGHHRLCSIEQLYSEKDNTKNHMNYVNVFSNIVPVKEIETIGFSRMWEVKINCDFSKQKRHFIKCLKTYFDIIEPGSVKANEKSQDIMMTFKDEEFCLKLKPSFNKRRAISSIKIFEKYIEPIMSNCFDYYSEVKILEADKVVMNKKGESYNLFQLNFTFSSPSIKEILEDCNKGYRYPQKSTCFNPKIEDGVIFMNYR